MKSPHLKKLIVVAMYLLCNNLLFAQVADTARTNQKDVPATIAFSGKNLSLDKVKKDKINILKINIPALFFKNISFQYERKLGRKNSLALAVRFRPKENLPFQGLINNYVDDTSIRTNLVKVGNFGITPEFRFHFSKKGALRGFYIAPFISYNYYNGDIPINYDDYDYLNNKSIEKTGVFKGSTSTFTVGFQLGVQWRLNENFTLDWWILGPNYGLCDGAFKFDKTLNDYERINLDINLKYKIKPSMPIDIIQSPETNPNGASFKIKGPWAGLRGFGLNIGYRF